jgi:hypothetical protein
MRIDSTQQHRIVEMAVQPKKEVAEKQGPQKSADENAKLAGKQPRAQQLTHEDAGSKVDIFA